MSSYWISEDGKAKVETLESYLYRHAKQMQITNHRLTVKTVENGDLQFVIRPNANSTEQLEFKVDDNQLYPADPAFGNDEKGSLLFMVSSKGKVFKADVTSLYLRQLEHLYKATKEKDETAIQEALKAIEDWEREWV